MMHENSQAPKKAALIAVDTGEYDVEVSLDELEELSHTAGVQVVLKASQKREGFDKATCVGSGRLEEIRAAAENEGAELLIFDHELSASQLRNIERATSLAVLDRTMLILDIFSQRATSNEGRLQVELAQQRYRLPRLAGVGVALSRLGGGIGTRGPGETKLETDRRHIRTRISFLEKELEHLEKRRRLMRERRRKDNVSTVAIVGYTNVGKSTLLNTLTDAGVLAQDMLFATLDPTARALLLPDGRSVLLIDTVGLIRRLPHHLVEAFKSTLEEAVHSDLILNLCDATSDELEEQLTVTRRLLSDLGAASIPVLTVLNKCDLLEKAPVLAEEHTVSISARTGQGLTELLDAMAKLLAPSQQRLRLQIPYAQGALLSEIREEGLIHSEEFTQEGILLDALVDNKIVYKVQDYIV